MRQILDGPRAFSMTDITCDSFEFRYLDPRTAKTLCGHYVWSESLEGYAFRAAEDSSCIGDIRVLDNAQVQITLPYEQTKLALETSLEHIEGNMRQVKKEKHSPSTMLAIRKLFTTDAERIKELLTHFTK